MTEAIHQMFQRTAERRGDHVAIETPGRRVTYRELRERANGIAATLLAGGAKRGVLVGLLASRTEDLAAGMLGVLQAGCAFMPLDRHSPAVRLESVVAEVRPRWWLVSPDLAGLAGDLRRDVSDAGAIILLGDEGPRSEQAPAVPEPDPESLCYVFFTSGSTGRPKGIAGRLKAIDHFIRWEIETFAIGDDCRVSQLTSPAFDAVLRDLFVPLAAGGTLCAPADREVVLDGARLADWIHGERLTLVHYTPTVFRSLLRQELTADRFPALRQVLLAGEPLLPADVRRWRAVFGDRIELVNLYGPSETTMIKLFHRVRPEDGEARMIPVGQPLPGARVIVLDEEEAPCPPGQVGEIVLRTPYRSLGYLNQPELTASVFVRNPFSDRPDDLIYRTGDLGRLREDGLLELLGRRDQQVKVRGVRVEIAPIEEALRSHPAVRDAAVVDRTDTQGDKFLCAYLVMGAGPGLSEEPAELDAGRLRDFLAARLPDAMVPSAFVRLESLPRTLTGKLDRRALPDPDRLAARLGAERLAPRTPLEEKLGALFQELLGVPEVGVRESFFALGGHSLLAAQLLARIRAELGVEVPLGRIFEAATVESLAGEVARLQAGHPAVTGIPLLPEADSYPLSFAQQRLWLVDQVETESSFYNIAAAVRLLGRLRVPLLRQALDEVVRRHESLRTVFAADRGRPRQIVRPPAPVALPVADLSGLPEGARLEEARRRAAAVAAGAFDLARGPLLRCLLLRLAADEHVMAYAVHHITADQWSTRLLAQEARAAYLALAGGSPPALPELPIQYRDFAGWQRERLDDAALAERLAWWRGRLAGAPVFLRLPTDHPRPAVQSFRGAREVWDLPAALAEPLRVLGIAEGGGLFPLFLTAFQILLGTRARQEDFVIASPVGFRDRHETENLIGLFVNTLLLRADLTGDPSLRALLARVRRHLLEAYAQGDVPLDRVIEELAPDRTLSFSPFLQAGLNFVELPPDEEGAAELTARPFGFDDGLSQFELNLILIHSAGSFQACLQYRHDLFARGTVAAMARELEVILEWLALRPDAALSAVQEALAREEESRRSREKARAESAARERFRLRARKEPDAAEAREGA
ncbi:MAG TPA: amino acid adenylation domain-containing protein [Thermoanaerobaculia bacterium]|nr:amino acid adenylation domain-containing protein [Thermoanaerobaculia bacterium]